MKKCKLSILLCLIVLSVFLISCSDKKEKQSNDNVTSYDILSATNLVNKYLTYLKNNDSQNIKKICTDSMLKNNKIQGKSNLNIISYKIDEVLELSDYSIFIVKVDSISNNTPYNLLEEYRINVIKESNGYKISDIKTSVYREMFIKEDCIRMRNKDNVKTNVVIYMEDIPNFISIKEDKIGMHKYYIPKNHFGNMIMSYDGLNAAMSTYDKNSYIALINIDESLAVQGNASKSTNQNSNSQNQNKGIGGIKEISIGKRISSLDLLIDSKIDFMLFSPGQDFLVVQYKDNKKNKCIRVYDLKKMELIPMSFEKSFSLDKVEVTFDSFDEELLYFQVQAKKDISSDERDIIGKYELNLKDFKIKKK